MILYSKKENLHLENGNFLGKGVGQFHDDIKEVKEGKIIHQTSLAPKTKMDRIIGNIKG